MRNNKIKITKYKIELKNDPIYERRDENTNNF